MIMKYSEEQSLCLNGVQVNSGMKIVVRNMETNKEKSFNMNPIRQRRKSEPAVIKTKKKMSKGKKKTLNQESSKEEIYKKNSTNVPNLDFSDEISESSRSSVQGSESSSNSVDEKSRSYLYEFSAEPTVSGVKEELKTESRESDVEKKLAKFSYRINDSRIGTLSFEEQNEEILEDISFKTYEDEYSYKTKNNGAMEDLCSVTRDSGITEEFSLSSELLLYKARIGGKTELEDDASTWRTQDSSQNILDENLETRHYLESNNDYSPPCPILCKDENTDKSSSTRSGTQSPDSGSTQRDNHQSRSSPCRIDYSSIDYNEEHSDKRPAPYCHDFSDIRMKNINLSLDQLYSAAKYEVEKTGFKLTETDPSIYSEDEEKKIEEDIIITELDSVSNRCTPTNSTQTCQQSKDGVESPREEPRMQVQVQELDKETFHFEDTPRTHLTEDKNGKQSSALNTTGENRGLDTCRDLEIQTFESPQENQEAKISDVFQNKIRNFIQTIENEEIKENHKPEDERKEVLDESGDMEEEERLSDEDLEQLKKKCLDRLKKSESRSEIQDYAANSSIQDFSNSQKLLKFLAESEEKDERTKSKVKTVSYSLHPDIPKLGDLLTKSVADLSEEVMHLNLELEKERRTITILKSGLEQSNLVTSENINQILRENKQRTEIQRKQYEDTVARHQAFIDQLIADKKLINEKCEGLATELRTVERRGKENLKAVETRHSIELNRLKHMSESSDKMKRERWMDQKVKKIKDQTAKCLELEVEKLMRKHSTQLSDIKAGQRRELEEQEQTLRRDFSRSFDQYRVQVEREKKEIIEEEKVAQLERFRKQAEQIQSFHQDEVQQLRDEIERERRKQEEERTRWMDEAEQIRKLYRDKADNEQKNIKEEMEDMKKALNRKHANELLTFKTNEESERKEFERKVNENFEKQWKDRESELRFKFSKERDLEIDRVIEKLELEMKKSREDSEKSFETRLKRLKMKHDSEIAEMVKEVEELKVRMGEMREKNMKTEENNHLLESINSKLELRVVELEEKKERLEEERKDITGVVRKEFTLNLENLTEEKNKLSEEINSMLILHKTEIHDKVQEQRRMKRDFEVEVQGLQEKVEEVVRRKEKMVEELTEQHELAVQRIHHLETIISQQGRELIISKQTKDLISSTNINPRKLKPKHV